MLTLQSNRGEMFSYFRNRSLFSQLIIPMFVVGIISAGAIMASALVLQNSVKALGEMYSASGERLKTLEDIDKDIANVRALSLKHLTSESAQDMNQIRIGLEGIEQRLRLNLPAVSKLLAHAHQAEQQENVILRDALASYLAGVEKAVRLSAEFEKESAFDLLTRIEDQHLTNIQLAMQTLMQYTIEDIAASRADLVSATNRNLQMNLAIDFLGGTMLLGMAFYVSRRTSVRINDLLKWSRRIADGDLSNHLVSDAEDEVGQLTDAMHDMVQNVARGRSELETARKNAEKAAACGYVYVNSCTVQDCTGKNPDF